MIVMRELFQNSSVIISVLMLMAIVYRIRHYHEPLGLWLPFVLICICVIVYYGLVYIDLHVADIMDSGFWSSTVRLITQISLLLFIVYAPRRPIL